MSFIVKSYGDGSLGDVSEITSSVNSYAAVTAITANSITIDAATKITGTADFTVGAKILIHVSATTGSTSALKIYLGKWCVATVTAVSGNVLTLDEDPPENVTNVGGSSIFIAARTIENFSPKMIAKYRLSDSTKGQGLCRCYIASATKLRNDEGLYSYDVISDPLRLSREMNIKNFGNGSFGDGTDLTTQLNNYATITAVDGKNVTYKDRTTAGLVQIQQGALVMIHFNHKSSSNVTDAGRFILANVLADNGTPRKSFQFRSSIISRSRKRTVPRPLSTAHKAGFSPLSSRIPAHLQTENFKSKKKAAVKLTVAKVLRLSATLRTAISSRLVKGTAPFSCSLKTSL